ncbi:hypothetical protein TNCV_1282971 [Trichonephila clavipes]|uniref:Uncharacterized protein n=1 Tax=Trichonephila clavipes TaxID=2585209 RepID=A0A8X6VK02_TRICX|nr:hypothetical protein TNCV_1282971 [Trichonephila clavipes]
MTIDELIYVNEQEQDIDELKSLDPVQSEYRMTRDLSMPPRQNKEKFQELLEFEWGRIIGIREGVFYYRAIGARVQLLFVCSSQFHSDASLKAMDRRAPNNSRNWQ